MQKNYYVYILATKKYGTIYIGVTGNLIKRIYHHKENLIDGFTKQYNIHKLVYFEIHRDIKAAISREKQIKHWNREWKINLIEINNPEWLDLYAEVV